MCSNNVWQKIWEFYSTKGKYRGGIKCERSVRVCVCVIFREKEPKWWSFTPFIYGHCVNNVLLSACWLVSMASWRNGPSDGQMKGHSFMCDYVSPPVNQFVQLIQYNYYTPNATADQLCSGFPLWYLIVSNQERRERCRGIGERGVQGLFEVDQ